MLIVMSLFASYFCYLSVDPMKSCLFLVLSLLILSPSISMGVEVWYSYFVCLVFLSGIFVILVYFTSLSKYSFFTFSFSFLIFLGFFFIPFFYFNLNLTIYGLYYSIYFMLIFWILFSLIYFMSFSSYFLNFSGALRKA